MSDKRNRRNYDKSQGSSFPSEQPREYQPSGAVQNDSPYDRGRRSTTQPSATQSPAYIATYAFPGYIQPSPYQSGVYDSPSPYQSSANIPPQQTPGYDLAQQPSYGPPPQNQGYHPSQQPLAYGQEHQCQGYSYAPAAFPPASPHGAPAGRDGYEYPNPTSYLRNPSMTQGQTPDERPWTDDDKSNLVDCYEQGLEWREVGKQLGRRPNDCMLKADELVERKSNHPRKAQKAKYIKWSPADDKKIVDFVKGRKGSWADLARSFPFKCQGPDCQKRWDEIKSKNKT